LLSHNYTVLYGYKLNSLEGFKIMMYLLEDVRRELSVEDTYNGLQVSAYVEGIGWVELEYNGYTKKQAVNAFLNYVALELNKRGV
jgi:hypothetical protein